MLLILLWKSRSLADCSSFFSFLEERFFELLVLFTQLLLLVVGLLFDLWPMVAVNDNGWFSSRNGSSSVSKNFDIRICGTICVSERENSTIPELSCGLQEAASHKIVHWKEFVRRLGIDSHNDTLGVTVNDYKIGKASSVNIL